VIVVTYVADKKQPDLFSRVEIADEKDPIRVASQIERRMFPDGAEARRARGEEVKIPPAKYNPREKMPERGGASSGEESTRPEPIATPALDDQTESTDGAGGDARFPLDAYVLPDVPLVPSRDLSSEPGADVDRAGTVPGVIPGAARPVEETRPAGDRDPYLARYKAMINERRFDYRQTLVVEVFLRDPSALTVGEVARDAGLTLDSARARVDELIALDVLVWGGIKMCGVIGTSCHAVLLKPTEEKPS
jgi:hypothetical protein